MTGATDAITEELVQQARAGYEQFRANDPAFLETIDPDVEWVVPDTLPGGGVLLGPLEVLEFLDRTSQLWDAHPDPGEFLPAGDRVLVLGTWRGVARATGVRVEIAFAHVLAYRDGKLVQFHNYLDAAKALQSLEPPT